METFSFSALGTEWTLLIDELTFSENHQKAIVEAVAVFEDRFSRFRLESEVNQFRTRVAGAYTVSEEFALLLRRAEQLRTLTQGRYDPAIGGILEHAGYDRHYRMEPDTDLEKYVLPVWNLSESEITIDGPIAFDFGGIGKGYCIDLVARLLKEQGYQYFLVEGGGDIYGTVKQDGSGFRIALEWPGKQDTAFGVVELKYQAVAVSDSFKRRWGAWHHIIDPQTKKPIEDVIGCAAVARSAFDADSMTSGLFLAPVDHYQDLATKLQTEYVVFEQNGRARVSAHWSGELF